MLKNNVREFRKEQGLRQEDFARELGVSRQTIIAIENGRYYPTLGLALRMAKFLGVTVEDLFLDAER